MRTPSFTVVANVPSAFLGNKPRRVVARPLGSVVARPMGGVVARPAGQVSGYTIDPTCNNNWYHGVRFYDANQNCVDINQSITAQVYNQYGYPIDANGNPEIGTTPAAWAMTGTQGQAWVQPNTGTMLDQMGTVITPTSTVYPSTTPSRIPGGTPTGSVGGGAVGGALAGNIFGGTPSTGGVNWPLIGAAVALGLVSIVVLVRNQQAPQRIAAPARRSPARRSSGRRSPRRRS